jgi:putative component of membrane protein insertase Oxa1/YidC/SpoIIIJ protein YidD
MMPNLFLPNKKFGFGILLLLFINLSTIGFAQKIELKNDLLLADSIAKKQIPKHEKRAYIFKDRPKTFLNSNPVSLLFGGSLYVYQNHFSQHLSASCLFHPSCSDFSKQAVQEFGLVKGTLLSLDRLSRCNRIAATDLNPAEIDNKTHKFHDPVKLYK